MFEHFEIYLVLHLNASIFKCVILCLGKDAGTQTVSRLFCVFLSNIEQNVNVITQSV